MIEQIEQNGIFYRLKSEEKTDFIKNEKYYSILDKDYIEYTRLPNGSIHIDKIVEHKVKLTIGIFDTVKKRLRLPLESKVYNSDNDYESKSNSRYLLCYVSIEKTQIKIIEEICDCRERKNDFEICYKLYHNVTIDDDLLEMTKEEPLYFFNMIKDQTNLATFNIDPKGSLDIDDAISVDIEKGIIYIHIVDITTHLKNNNKLEKRAFELGQTLYLAEGINYLFPKKCSEDDFSLLENKERPVITLEYSLDTKEYKVYRSRIMIKKSYSYKTAQDALENKEEVFVFLDRVIQKPEWIYSSFEIPKRKLIIRNSEIERIEFEHSNRMNKIIEALMILTNCKITEYLDKITNRTEQSIPERYHEKGAGIILKDIEIDNSYMLLEELKKYKLAKYSEKDSGHYALDVPLYTHFTSPIRRSFDILVHKILAGSRIPNRKLCDLIEHLNERKEYNKKLVDFYERSKLLSYLEKTKGNYDIIITKISRHGITIYIEEIGYYDFIHISKILEGVRWKYTEDKLVGDNGVVLEKEKKCRITIRSINWFELAVEGYKISEFL